MAARRKAATPKKRVRRGPRFRNGDDLTKRWLDRFFRAANEPWEFGRKTKKKAKKRTR
ncbi:hypothetical protein HYW68_02380 [Candidatus Parcubacteria bacterium]|nr:hypothetical protein [Candidatus Parcubacteria bacterium]